MKTGKEIPESSGLEFLEKFSADNFSSSDVEDNTRAIKQKKYSRLMLLSTLLANLQKSHESSF